MCKTSKIMETRSKLLQSLSTDVRFLARRVVEYCYQYLCLQPQNRGGNYTSVMFCFVCILHSGWRHQDNVHPHVSPFPFFLSVPFSARKHGRHKVGTIGVQCGSFYKMQTTQSFFFLNQLQHSSELTLARLATNTGFLRDLKWAPQTKEFRASSLVLPFTRLRALSHRRLRLAVNGIDPTGTLKNCSPPAEVDLQPDTQHADILAEQLSGCCCFAAAKEVIAGGQRSTSGCRDGQFELTLTLDL